MTTQPDNSGGAMLALYPAPDLAAALVIPGGLPAEELHVTVAYTGTADQVDAARLHAAGETVTMREPITATISGHARFTGGETDVIVALVDSPELEQLRRDTVDALTAQGIPLPADHGYIPHITLAYLDQSAPDPVRRIQPTPAGFGALSVVHGTDRADLLLDSGLGAIAREAYAQGWAASGGPMTDRVRAGSIAAVSMALENADRPGILEATLQAGHTEGTWAALYHRREQAYAANHVAITAAWKRLGLAQHAGEIVRRARRRANLTEAAGPADWLADLVRQLADAGLSADQLAHAREVLTAAITRAEAEGQAGAMALSADQLGQIGFSFDLAFDHAYDALSNAKGLIGDPQANKWLNQLLGSQAQEVGAVLSQMTRDGATAAEMEEEVAALLEGVESRAMILGIDVLTSRAMSQGALDLYRSEGIEMVDIVTAADQRVCTDGPNCAGAEMNSPYRLTDAPIPGLHPLCRCCLAATVPLPGETLAPFMLADAAAAEELADEAIAAQAPLAAAAPADKKAARQAARERYQQIAAREPYANLAAQLDQAVANMAGRVVTDEEKGILRQYVGDARQAGMADEALAAVEEAIESGDLDAVRDISQQVAADEGLAPIGKSGDLVEFDPELHQSVADGVDFEPGEKVQILKQGHELTLPDGSVVRLDRAVVKTPSTVADGLDAMEVPSLRNLATEFDLTGARTMERDELLTKLRERGAVSPDRLRAMTDAEREAVMARQEEIAASRAIPWYHPDLEGLEDLAELVRSGFVDATREEFTGGAVGVVERITLPDGRSFFSKTSGSWLHRTAESVTDSEQLASMLGQAIGAPVPRLVRDSATRIFTDWADGKPGAEWFENRMLAELDGPPDTAYLREVVESPDGRRLGLFDLLTQNQDRHTANWILSEDGVLTGIDHGNAWWEAGPAQLELDDAQFAAAARDNLQGPFVRDLFVDQAELEDTGQVVFRNSDMMTPDDVVEIRTRLETLRPDFVRLGHQDWLDYSLRVLDMIEPYAKGSRSIFDA